MKNTKQPLTFVEAESQHMYPDYYYSGIRNNPNARAGLKTIHTALLDPVKDAHTGTVITAPCGMGKTTVIQALTMESALGGARRIVVATDRCERLTATLAEATRTGQAIVGRDPIINVSDGDRMHLEELWKTPYRQVVGVTPQRIINMDRDMIAPIYADGIRSKQTGSKMYKDIFLCDEAVVDVQIDSYTPSQLWALEGYARETIAPDAEGDTDDGHTAKVTGDLIGSLLDLVRQDIDRINAAAMTYGNRESAKDRVRVDVFIGYRNILCQYDTKIADIAIELNGIIQILMDKGRIKADSTRKPKIEKLAENVEKIKNTTKYSEIQTWTKDIREYLDTDTCRKYIPEDAIRKLAVLISDLMEVAKIKTAPNEIRRIFEKNRKNIKENAEGCVGIIDIDSFLSIFSEKNVVMLRTVRKGRSKIDNRPQVEITVAQYVLDRLPWGMMPVVILDGTGDVNPAYTDGRYRFDMIDDFHRPHVPMHIIQYGEISGSYDLTKDGRNKARRLFDNMPQVLGDNYDRINPADTVLTCSKDLADIARRYAPGHISNTDVATYMSPQLTGSNQYKNRKVIVKIGAVTISQYVSLLQICCRRPDIWQDIVNMPETERQAMWRTIYNYHASADNCQYYSQIRDNQVRTAMVSIVQEFQRLRCRNYPTSDDPAELQRYGVCIMWIMRGREQGTYPVKSESLSEEIVRRIIDRFGARYTYHEPILDAYKADSMTPMLVRGVYQDLPEGAEYSYATIAADVHANEATVRQAVSRDTKLKEWMDADDIVSQRPMIRRKVDQTDNMTTMAAPAQSADNIIGRIANAYRGLRYGERYTYAGLAERLQIDPLAVERTMRYNRTLQAMAQYDVADGDEFICRNPDEDIKVICVWHRQRGAYDSYTAETCRAELNMDPGRFQRAWDSPAVKKAIAKDAIQDADGSRTKKDKAADDAVAAEKRKERNQEAAQIKQQQIEDVINWWYRLGYGSQYSVAKAAKECHVPQVVAAEALQTPAAQALRIHDVEIKTGAWRKELEQLRLSFD